jgi:hypothetical protein
VTPFDGEQLGKEAVQALYQHINWAIGPRIYRLWHPTTLPEGIMEQYQTSSLYGDIQLLARVANGGVERDRASEELLDEVAAALQNVWEDLRRPPLGATADWLPAGTDRPPLLQLLEVVRYWLVSDELITLSEAAELFTGRQADQAGFMVIQRLTARRGQGREEGLQVFTDPFEPNPQRNKRVRRADVLRLKELREHA